MPTLIEIAEAINTETYDCDGHWYSYNSLKTDLHKLSTLLPNTPEYWVLRTHITDGITDNMVHEKFLRGKPERGQEVSWVYNKVLEEMHKIEQPLRDELESKLFS